MSTGPSDTQIRLMAQLRTAAFSDIAQLGARLPELCRSLRLFNLASVVKPLAGLLTIPAHQTATRRISALIHLAVQNCKGAQRPTHQQLGEWLDRIHADPITHLEDPAEDVHVSNLVTERGNTRLFQGYLDHIDYHLGHTLWAVAKLNRTWTPSVLRNAHAMLSISDAIAVRAGAVRNTMADSELRARVRPSQAMVSDLHNRTTLGPTDLRRIGVSVNDLRPFIFHSATPRPSHSVGSIGHSELDRRPLLLGDGGVTAMLPHALGPAVQRYLLERVATEDNQRSFGRRLTEKHIEELGSLAVHNWDIRLLGSFRADVRSGVADGVGLFDEGGYVHVVYAPDTVDAVVASGLESTHDCGLVVTQLTATVAKALATQPDYRRGLTILVHGGVGRPFVAGFKMPPAHWRVVCMSVADFALLSWDTGISALRVWKLLDQEQHLAQYGMHVQSVGGFVDLYGCLRSQDFAFAPATFAVTQGGSISIWPEFAGSLRCRLRTNLDRHGAVGIDGETTVEVQRKTIDESTPVPGASRIYASRDHVERGELLACVEINDVPWWIHASGRGHEASHRLAIYGVWESTVNLLSRLAPLFESGLEVPRERSVVCHMRFPDIQSYNSSIEEDAKAPDEPHIALTDSTATIDYRVAHLQRFARADNVADRELAAVLVRVGFAVAKAPAPSNEVVSGWVARVIASDSARSFHMTPVQTAAEEIYSSIALDDPRLETSEDRAWSHLRLAGDAGYEGAPGPLPEDLVPTLLHNAVAAIWGRIKEKLVTLDRRSVVERALANWEAIQKDRAEWQRAAAALLAIHENDSAVIEMANQRENERARAGLACRVIAEMALSTAPYGTGFKCGIADLDALVAQVCRLLECAAQSDAHYYKLSSSAPIAQPNGSLEFGPVGSGMLRPYWEALGERHFREDAGRYSARFERRQQSEGPGEDFEEAFRAEFGLTLEECAKVLRWFTNEALRKSTVQFVVPKSELLDSLESLGLRDAEKPYRRLVLAPRSRWDEQQPASARQKDWYPWRYNRRLSILRRPIVQLSADDDPMVLLSPTRFEQSMVYLTQVAFGRLPGEMFDSKAMKRYVGRMVNKYGHDFNQQVGAMCRELGWKARVEVPMTYFGAESALGDIDVVAWHDETGIVYVIECKRLRMDRTIGEVGERLTEYSVGRPGGDDELSALERHLRRLAYVRGDGREWLVELTQRRGQSVDVRSALVTDIPTPMQFSKRHAEVLDAVTDYSALDRVLRRD